MTRPISPIVTRRSFSRNNIHPAPGASPGRNLKTMNTKVTPQEIDKLITEFLRYLYETKTHRILLSETFAWIDGAKRRIYAHATSEKIARIINDDPEEK